jgi:CRISPR-associated exonuclease Cas4
VIAIDGPHALHSSWRPSSLSFVGLGGHNELCTPHGSHRIRSRCRIVLARYPISRRKTGIPSGEPFYQDLTSQPFRATTLCSSQFGISGKPDCLIRTADGIVPVELKKAKRPLARGEVYPNHMIQTLAYCALVEEHFKARVPYGLVVYAGQRVRRVEYTEPNRRWLIETIQPLRAVRAPDQVRRNHHRRTRCTGCGLRNRCNQSLV